MGTHANKLPKNSIVQLDSDEMADPISVANDFFSAFWLPRQLKILKQWRNDAAFESPRSNIESAATLLFNHELTIKLIEAAWLLRDQKLGNVHIKIKKEIDTANWYIKKERKKLRDYPKHLTLHEMTRPSLVLKKFFNTYKLADYREILKIWLYDALGSNFIEESLTKAEVIKVYEQLVKLYEAMWLISERVKRGDRQ